LQQKVWSISIFLLPSSPLGFSISPHIRSAIP
jgi:hypothetical protein